MYECTWSRFTQTSFSCCVLQSKNWCSTLILCVSPLVALWPLPNLWLTLWRHSAIWGSPLSDLINHNISSQAPGSPSFSSGCCIVFFPSPSLRWCNTLFLLFYFSSYSLITPSNLTVTLIRVQLSDVQINIIPACHALNPSVYQNFLPHCLNILFSPSFSPSFLKGWKSAEERLVLVSEAIELGWLTGRALTETHILCWKNVLNRHPVWGLSHCCPKLTVTAL